MNISVHFDTRILPAFLLLSILGVPPVNIRQHCEYLLEILCFYQTYLPLSVKSHPLDYSLLLKGTRQISERTGLAQAENAADKSVMHLYLLKLLVHADVTQFVWTKEVGVL